MSNISETITVMPGDSIHVKKDFFSDKKAYLLVGGLGSLGLQIAQWMYKVRIFLFALIVLTRLLEWGSGNCSDLSDLARWDSAQGRYCISAHHRISREPV
jgi:hypothetical protein